MAKRKGMDRREFVTTTTGAAAAAAVGPTIWLKRPQKTLKILQWSHFVPSYDVWFDKYAKDWGTAHGAEVTVDHIALADLTTRANAEVAAQQGHDLFQFLSPPGAFELQVLDMADVVRDAERQNGPLLDLCKRSTYNPVTRKWFGVVGAALAQVEQRPVKAQHLQPRDAEVVRLQRQLRARSRRLSEEHLDRDWDAQRAGHVGRPGHRGTADQGQAPRDPDPDRHWDVAGAGLEHGRARDAVVVRRLDPGRQRERGLEVRPGARSADVRGAAVQGGDDAGGVQLERRVEQPGVERPPDGLHPQLHLGVPHRAGQ